MSDRPAAGLYLHIPFCSSICPYCDFAVTLGDRAARRAFVSSLEREIDLSAGSWRFDTVYFGGGTPSALESEDLETLLEALHRSFDLTEETRVSMEVNPEDVDATRAEEWRLLDVDTISLGVQSFDDGELRFLGRKHDGSQARRSVGIIKATGFRTSIDLIFGLPRQSRTALARNIDETLRLEPDHISCYQLTVHDGTAFGRKRANGRLEELAEEAQAELYAEILERLESAGYEAYEVSNFARSPEHRSKHNQKYWHRADYLGVGPSAHSLRGDERWWNERQLGPWSARVNAQELPIAGREKLSLDDRALEDLMLGLRTRGGIDLARYRALYGTDLVELNRAVIERYLTGGLLQLTDGHLSPTRKGLAVAERLAADLDAR